MRTPLLISLLLSACVDRFETEVAYAEQGFSCGLENVQAFAEQLAACAELDDEGGDCTGVVSVEGIVQNEPAVMTTFIDRNEVEVMANANNDPSDPESFWDVGVVKNIEFNANGPYFRFTLTFDDLGGYIPDMPDGGEHLYEFAPTATALPDDTRSRFTMTAAGATKGFTGSRGGYVDFTTFSKTALAGTFDGSFQDNNELRGCFQIDRVKVVPR